MDIILTGTLVLNVTLILSNISTSICLNGTSKAYIYINMEWVF